MKAIIILLFPILYMANGFAQNNNGVVSVQVLGFCEIKVDHPDKPIHFTAFEKDQHQTKRVEIVSNGKWILGVRPQDRYLYCNEDKIDCNLISYWIGNITGPGTITSPDASYLLYQTPYNPPHGEGNVIFDVIFRLDTRNLPKVKWGNYNTKVEITCTPDTN